VSAGNTQLNRRKKMKTFMLSMVFPTLCLFCVGCQQEQPKAENKQGISASGPSYSSGVAGAASAAAETAVQEKAAADRAAAEKAAQQAAADRAAAEKAMQQAGAYRAATERAAADRAAAENAAAGRAAADKAAALSAAQQTVAWYEQKVTEANNTIAGARLGYAAAKTAYDNTEAGGTGEFLAKAAMVTAQAAFDSAVADKEKAEAGLRAARDRYDQICNGR
jgi:hypothetical protein